MAASVHPVMTGPRARAVGVISDTHGLLRPEAVMALRGVDAIVHAGDIGTSDVLDRLGAIAPVTAVRGNNDRRLGGEAAGHRGSRDRWCAPLRAARREGARPRPSR